MPSTQEKPFQKLFDWPHSPAHRLGDPGAYIVTAGTYRKQEFFSSPARLTFLANTLIELARKYQWSLQAWAVFANHYHLVAEAPNPASLPVFVRHLHSLSARHVNQLDNAAERRVWFQYWDTHLTNQKSYMARLNYVHQNPVRHGLVSNAEKYPWCSAGWFAKRAPRAFYHTVIEFPSDKVNVPDDYAVTPFAWP